MSKHIYACKSISSLILPYVVRGVCLNRDIWWWWSWTNSHEFTSFIVYIAFTLSKSVLFIRQWNSFRHSLFLCISIFHSFLILFLKTFILALLAAIYSRPIMNSIESCCTHTTNYRIKLINDFTKKSKCSTNKK